jgi:hypothetical protein
MGCTLCFAKLLLGMRVQTFMHDVFLLFRLISPCGLYVVRFLNLVRPFLPFLPEVSSPERKVREPIPICVVFVLIHYLGPVYTKSIMDSRNAAHLLGLQPSPSVRHHVLRLV